MHALHQPSRDTLAATHPPCYSRHHPFLVTMMAWLPLVLVLLAGPSALAVKKHSLLEELSPAITAELQQLENDYGIQLSTVGSGYTSDIRHFTFTAAPLEEGRLRLFLSVFLKEWKLYPKSLVLKTDLKRILLCQNLRVNGFRLDAAPNFEKKTLYFCLFTPSNKKSLEEIVQFYQQAIHHQLFHMVGYQMSDDFNIDPAWSTLNTKEFRYGQPLFENPSGPLTTKVTNRFYGFISSYSLLGMAQDKAELFSRMMSNLHEMECRAQDDVILSRKLARLKQVLKEFCPEMDDAYWNNLRHLERPRLTLKGEEDPWALAHPTLPALPRLVEPPVPFVVVRETICEVPVRRTLLCHRLRRCCR